MIHLAGDLPSVQKALFRNLLALLLSAILLRRRRVSLRVAPGNRLYLLGRAAAGTAGLLCNFYAVDHMVLADANMLNKLSPFFAILFSFFLLRERPRPVQLAGVAVAFGGALLIARPTGSAPLLPAALGVLGGMGAGLAYTFVRKLGKQGENGDRIVFYFSLFSCAVTAPFFFLIGRPMTLRQFLILMAAGLFAAGGQFFITRAYFFAPARELSVYEYAQVLFAAAWGYALFRQTPHPLSVVGYAVIIGAGVVIFLYSNRLGPFRGREGPAGAE